VISAVQWEKQAQADRETIFRYLYREAGVRVASATDVKFIRMASLLSENPLAGTKVSTEKQRKLAVPRFPFIILYVAETDGVRILRILHTSQKITGRYQR
jgi:plasmid stabilization system protein ParE